MNLNSSFREVFSACGVSDSVTEQYDLVATSVETMGMGMGKGKTKNQNDQEVLLITTEAGVYALKRSNLSPKMLGAVLALCEKACAIRPNLTATVIPTRNGDAFSADSNVCFYMTKWRKSAEIDLRIEVAVLRAAVLLGEWHSAVRDEKRTLPGTEHPSHPWSRFHVFKQRITSVLKYLDGPDFLGEWTPHVEDALTRLKLARETLEDRMSRGTTAMRQDTVCHGNFVQQNLVFHRDGDMVINCENAYRGPIEFEFALFLHRYMPGFRWNHEVLKKACDAYRRGLGRHDIDTALFDVFLRLPMRPLQILSWYLEQTKKFSETEYVRNLVQAWELEERRDAALVWLRSTAKTRESVNRDVGAASLPKSSARGETDDDLALSVHVAPRSRPNVLRNQKSKKPIQRNGSRVVRRVKFQSGSSVKKKFQSDGPRLFGETD